MTDIERVRQMVRDGRISEAEGAQLIAVLEDAQTADDELASAGQEIDAKAHKVDALAAPGQIAAPGQSAALSQSAGPDNNPTPDNNAATGHHAAPLPALDDPAAVPLPEPVVPATPSPARAPEPPSPPSAPFAPEGTRWVSLQMLAGNLDVVVDDALEEPEIESDGPVDVIVERAADGFKVSWDQPSGSFLDKVFGRLRGGNLSMRLPPGYGLSLAATAGDVDLDGVHYLRGHLTAGDLDARGLKGIDFTSRAGDIEVEAELTAGAHRLNVTAGNVEVRLAATSSVAITADASIGDISSRVPGVKPTSRGLGEGLKGTYGAGAATLDIAVTTGKIELEVRDV